MEKRSGFFSVPCLYFQKYERYYSDIYNRSSCLSVSCPFLQERCSVHKLLQAPR